MIQKVLPFTLMLFVFASACDPGGSPAADNSGSMELLDTSRVLKVSYAFGNNDPSDSCYGGKTIFDEIGRRKETYDYSSCGELFKKVFYEYDEEGLETGYRIESNLENVRYSNYYNENGQLVESRAADTTRVFQYRLLYFYDSLGQRTEYRGLMADGSAFNGTSRKSYTWKDGRKLLTECYSGENFDEPGYRILHRYDEAGNSLGDIMYRNPDSEKGDTGRMVYEYH